jgi:hypothetical protein
LSEAVDVRVAENFDALLHYDEHNLKAGILFAFLSPLSNLTKSKQSTDVITGQ